MKISSEKLPKAEVFEPFKLVFDVETVDDALILHELFNSFKVCQVVRDRTSFEPREIRKEIVKHLLSKHLKEPFAQQAKQVYIELFNNEDSIQNLNSILYK